MVPGECNKLSGPRSLTVINHETIESIQVRALDVDGNLVSQLQERLQILSESDGLQLEGETSVQLIGGVADFRGIVAHAAQTSTQAFRIKMKGGKRIRSASVCIELTVTGNQGKHSPVF